MTTSEFDKLTKAIWDACMRDELGFKFSEGVFCRELPDGVLQIVILDLDVKKGSTFRVIVGFNSKVIVGELSPVDAGVFGVRYLGARGLSFVPDNFPCFSKEAAEKSLLQTLAAVKNYVVPWFAAHESVDALLEVIEEQYPFIKGKILFHAGRLGDAKRYLMKHFEFLVRQKKTRSVEDGVRETQEMLKLCP